METGTGTGCCGGGVCGPRTELAPGTGGFCGTGLRDAGEETGGDGGAGDGGTFTGPG